MIFSFWCSCVLSLSLWLWVWLGPIGLLLEIVLFGLSTPNSDKTILSSANVLLYVENTIPSRTTPTSTNFSHYNTFTLSLALGCLLVYFVAVSPKSTLIFYSLGFLNTKFEFIRSVKYNFKTCFIALFCFLILIKAIMGWKSCRILFFYFV